MKYKAVLFDMDGTVLDTLDDIANSVNYSLRHFGFPERSRDEICRFTGNGARRLISLSVPEACPPDLFETVLSFYIVYYNDHCLIKTKPYNGIIELMDCIHRQGGVVGVISNKPEITVKELSKLFFSGMLDITVGDVPELRKRKPAPDAVIAACESLGLRLDECVYVGDSEVDLATAANAGIECIAVSWGFRPRELLESCGAPVIADSVEQLRALLEI